MKTLPHRRRFLQLTAGAVALPFVSRMASGQADWPQRYVTLTHGFVPGGGVDTTARILADGLSKRLGQQVVVESKPGAGTTLAAAQLARAAADGHTIRCSAVRTGQRQRCTSRCRFDRLTILP